MPKSRLTLFLCGDVMTGRGIDQILPNPCDPELHERFVRDARDYVHLAERVSGPIDRPTSYRYVWGDALAELARAVPDARIVNFETAVTTASTPEPKGINYRMNPANLPVLREAGIDICTLANNHVLDWGEAGLVQTLKSLRAAGIAACGAGESGERAADPAVVTTPAGRRVRVFAFAAGSSGVPEAWAAAPDRPGVNYLPDLSMATAGRVAEAVLTAREPGDLAVISIHWGGNWGYDIPDEQRAFARRLIDAGAADAVHGHSSHHVKGIEIYGERPIFYGCGDFLNDYEGIGGHGDYRDDLAILYFPSFTRDGRLERLTMTPMRIEQMQLHRASQPETRILADIFTREGEAKRLNTAARIAEDGRLQLVSR